jgi:gentisate 1,2-dioxygenase
MRVPEVQDPAALASFKQDLAPLNLMPLWGRTNRLVPGSACVPAIWSYAQTRPLLDQACGLITKKQADRRALVMENPALRGTSYISNALFAGLQIILLSEVAASHRHTPNALRFVVEGEGAYTSVDGIKIDMRPGDFVVTPAWAWHDHGNLGHRPVVWMDGLDTPFVELFGAHFRENYPQDIYPVHASANNSVSSYGYNLLPTHQHPSKTEGFTPLLVYTFDRTREALSRLAGSDTFAPDPVHGYKLRYAHPVHGGYPFTTMAAFMQWLPAPFSGQAYRSTENTIFNVAEGACRVSFGGATHHLNTHDVMVIPPWETYAFEADQTCLLFSFSDRAAQQALGFWREEQLPA